MRNNDIHVMDLGRTKVYLTPNDAASYYRYASHLSPDYVRAFPADYRPSFEEQKVRLATAIAVSAGEPYSLAADLARTVSMPTSGYAIERGSKLDDLRKQANERIAGLSHDSQAKAEAASSSQGETSSPTASARSAAASTLGLPRLDLSTVARHEGNSSSRAATSGATSPDSPATAVTRNMQKTNIAPVPASEARKTSVDAQPDSPSTSSSSELRPQTRTFLASHANRDDFGDLTERSQKVASALQDPKTADPSALPEFLKSLAHRNALGNLTSRSKEVAVDLKTSMNRTPPTTPRGIGRT